MGSLSRSLVSKAAIVNTASASSDQSANYLRPRVLLTTVQGAYLTVNSSGPQAQPTSTPEPTPEPEPPPAYYTYTVQPGDTLAGIAAASGIHPDYILWNNPEVSDDPDLLVVGQSLLIPGVDGLLYTVKLGDTLSDLATFYGIDVQAVVNFAPNGLATADAVIEGTELILPGAVPPPPPPPPPPPAPAPAPGPAPAPAPSGGYTWPFVGSISSYFGEPRGAGYYHTAIDIDGFGRYGAPVVASASGTVVLVSWQEWGLGYHIIIRHTNGSETVYAHLSDMYVGIGQVVGQGETIGTIGTTGYSTGPHLHFELHIGGGPVNPLAYLP